MRVMEVSTVVQSLLVSKRPDQIQTASKRVSVHPSSRADCPLKTSMRLLSSGSILIPPASRITAHSALSDVVRCARIQNSSRASDHNSQVLRPMRRTAAAAHSIFHLSHTASQRFSPLHSQLVTVHVVCRRLADIIAVRSLTLAVPLQLVRCMTLTIHAA